jgi:hypothetical protein
MQLKRLVVIQRTALMKIKFCDCKEVGAVARDMSSTCMKCGGIDAYKKSKLRHKNSDKKNEYPEGVEWLMICGDSNSMRTLKRCYLKHVKNDDSIGWDELTDEIATTLAATMGDDKFFEWIENTK